ncbi:hypothetical protein [Actinoallomurus iriomotensis]|nr:hypothetical protein [Actinoallomurus iriomotensis]
MSSNLWRAVELDDALAVPGRRTPESAAFHEQVTELRRAYLPAH